MPDPAPVHLCIDIDNVLADTDPVMRRVIAAFTGGRVKLDREHVSEFDYHLCKDAGGACFEKEEWKPIHELFAQPRHLLAIAPMAGAVEGMWRLSREITKVHTKSKLHVVTSRLPQGRRATVEWLETHNFPPHDLHFVGHREKHVYLRPFTAAVEDDYDQAKLFSDAGTPCLLLRHPWNESKPIHAQVNWATDWGEAVSTLLALVTPPAAG